jgi:hypothetical protein
LVAAEVVVVCGRCVHGDLDVGFAIVSGVPGLAFSAQAGSATAVTEILSASGAGSCNVTVTAAGRLVITVSDD